MQQQTPAQPGAEMTSESKTLWMGAIQPLWDDQFLYSIFPPNELVSVKVIRNLPAGYAFLEFVTHEVAKNILESYNGAPIPGTSMVFRLNWAPGAASRRSSGFVQEYSLFVGDLSPEVTDAVLQEAFQSRYPACRSAKVVMDSATGSSKGYGFVRFTDKAQSEEALQAMNGVTLGGRVIRVSNATARRHGSSMYPGQFPFRPQDNRINNGYGVPFIANPPFVRPSVDGEVESNTQQSVSNQSEEATEQSAAAQESFSSPENTTVFVGNLDPSVTEEQLGAHFQGFGNIVQIKIPPNRGCGFVKFETREDAERALSIMHGSSLSGLRIRLDWGKANAGRHQNPLMGHDSYYHQQYYMAQWQAHQQAQAYYYRFGNPSQTPMYMVPQQYGIRQPEMFAPVPMPVVQTQPTLETSTSHGVENPVSPDFPPSIPTAPNTWTSSGGANQQ